MKNTFDRRRFLQTALAMSAAFGVAGVRAQDRAASDAGVSEETGKTLAPWQPGYLDIHHIATGRGDATLIIMPDGTSMMIDAGVTNDPTDVSVPTRPNDTRRAGEWMGRYVKRHLQAAGRSSIDYFMLTHFHPDHIGDVNEHSPLSSSGTYRLTGLMDVDAIVPIDVLIDRDYPSYAYPTVWTAPFATNYFAYVRTRIKEGRRVERFQVGRADQFRPLGRVAVPRTCEVRNLAAGGEVWLGEGTRTHNLFPPIATLAQRDYPNENVLSAAIRLRYGKFGYFAAGDMTSYTYDGALPWMDVLTEVARVCGPVDVASAPHHGFFDALSADSVRSLHPQAWMINTWHVTHPDLLQLLRMLSDRLYPGPRDVFATTVTEQNLRANPWATKRMRSTDGHIVIRVAPGGDGFRIFVTDNSDELDRVKLVTGPYISASHVQGA